MAVVPQQQVGRLDVPVDNLLVVHWGEEEGNCYDNKARQTTPWWFCYSWRSGVKIEAVSWVCRGGQLASKVEMASPLRQWEWICYTNILMSPSSFLGKLGHSLSRHFSWSKTLHRKLGTVKIPWWDIRLTTAWSRSLKRLGTVLIFNNVRYYKCLPAS